MKKHILLLTISLSSLAVNAQQFLINLTPDNYSAGTWTNTGSLGGTFTLTGSAEVTTQDDTSCVQITASNTYLESSFNRPASLESGDFTVYAFAYDSSVTRAIASNIIGWGSRSYIEAGAGSNNPSGIDGGDTLGFQFALSMGDRRMVDSYFGDVNGDDIYTQSEWHHIAVTWDSAGKIVRIYVDGVASVSQVRTEKKIFRMPDTKFIIGGAYASDNITSFSNAAYDGTPAIASIKVKEGTDDAATVLAEFNAVITNASNVNDALANSIQAYPNPASDELTIASNLLTENVSFSLVNTLGVEIDVVANQLSSTEYSFDIASLEKGMYILKVITDNGFGIKTIIKE